MHSHYRGRSAVLSAATSLILATPALAQEKDGAQLEEVIVTAQRSQSSLQQTPVAVTAFSAEALEERGVTDLLDVGTYTPNLVVGTRDGTNAGGFTLRGMGMDAVGSSVAVGIYVDDVYYPSQFGNLLGLFDVERLEVLRGPQGTLFGRNTIAGAIQYVTVKPGRELDAYVKASAGNNEHTDFQGAVNIPLGERLAMRLGLGSTVNGGYVRDLLHGIDRGELRDQIARLQLRWEVTDRLTVDFKGEALKQKGNGRASEIFDAGLGAVNDFALFPTIARLNGETRLLSELVLPTKDYQSPGSDSRDFIRYTYSAAQIIGTYAVSDAVTFKSISAFSASRLRRAVDGDSTPLWILGAGPDPVEVDGAEGGPLYTDLWSQELQASGRAASERLQWTAGLYYYNSDDYQRSTDGGYGPLDPVVPSADRTTTRTESKAIYTQVTWDFTDRLAGTLGVRYSEEQVTAFNRNPAAADPVTGAMLVDEETFTDTSPHVGLTYEATADLMVYAKASKGFRAGGFTLFTGIPLEQRTFAPETAWTYEAGTRMEFLDRRLRVNPTVFYTDWQDIQFNVLTPVLDDPSTPRDETNVLLGAQNAGDAEIKGAELETLFAATDQWLFSAAASYIDGEYTRIDPRVINFVTGEPNLGKDDELQYSPKYKFSAGVRYTHPLTGGAQIVSSMDYAWTDEMRSAVTRSDKVQLPSYSLISARVQYDSPDDRWNVALWGTNLADERYFTGGVDYAGGGTTGATTHDPGRPREYGVTLRYNFN